MITRRHCLSAAVAALAAPMALPVLAQKRLPVIGFLEPQGPFTPEQRAQNSTILGLRDLGWELGKTLNIEVVYAEGDHDRLPALAAALVAKKVDLIVTRGTAGAIAAKRATDTIPIVTSGPDLVALGLAQSLARPGGNITGLTVMAGGGSINAKRLELLKLALPAAKHVAYIYSPGQNSRTDGMLAVAQAQGVTLSLVKFDRTADLEAAFAEISRNRPDAIWCADTVANFGNRARLAAVSYTHLARAHRARQTQQDHLRRAGPGRTHRQGPCHRGLACAGGVQPHAGGAGRSTLGPCLLYTSGG